MFSKLSAGLKKTRMGFFSGINRILGALRSSPDELFDTLEEALLLSDMGPLVVDEIMESLRSEFKRGNLRDEAEIRQFLTNEIAARLTEQPPKPTYPLVILIVGVNGTGKTTTVGKLLKWYKDLGKTVLVAAADTFRAAAIEQLEIWSKRADVHLVRHKAGADPAAVVFDGCAAAKARGIDVLICDTAGRMHNKKNLMDELSKINRTISSQFPEATRETYLVLDATTGQNALNQAKLFVQACDVTGLILTKLDGTTKGGMVVAIKAELGLGVRFVTVGEGIDDIMEFVPGDFARALFEEAG